MEDDERVIPFAQPVRGDAVESVDSSRLRVVVVRSRSVFRIGVGDVDTTILVGRVHDRAVVPHLGRIGIDVFRDFRAGWHSATVGADENRQCTTHHDVTSDRFHLVPPFR